jgi:formylglycine-generating enzyme required for sulfatase activity
MLFGVFVLLSALSMRQVAEADIRGIKVKALDKATGQQEEIRLYRRMIAVIIGIDRYPNLSYDQQLSYAVSDAKAVERTLRERFQFDQIYTLYNKHATKEAIVKLLEGTLAKTDREDAVFIFFSGHAITDETEFGEMGYLVPCDGTFKRDELYQNLSMSQLKTDTSRRIKAKHVFYVVDACYGGLLLALKGSGRETGHDIGYLQEMTREPVRQVLTAGSKDQPVLDGGPKGHSVFTGRLIEALERTTDYITAGELSEQIKRKVYSDAQARGHVQTPQDGALFGTGDFVFVPKVAASLAPPAPLEKPSQGDFSIDDLEREAERIEKNKAAWAAQLRKMQSAFDQVTDLEKQDLTSRKKVVAWERFLEAFEADNPYSRSDDTMRQKAAQQAAYWEEEARRPTPTPAQTLRASEDMVWIPGGTFRMGSNEYDDEKPVHTLTVSGFWISKYEITVGQYKKFVRATGHRALPDWVSKFSPTDNHPVVGVSWNNAVAYCKWAGMRLPTEAEWEYAARGGLKGKKYPWGDRISHDNANYDEPGVRDRWKYTAPVGSFSPNGYGLHDMVGNVWEWCADWYDSGYYVKSPENNPTGPVKGTYRVLRGGSWGGNPSYLRCANRYYYTPTFRYFDYLGFGFRCVRSSP